MFGGGGGDGGTGICVQLEFITVACNSKPPVYPTPRDGEPNAENAIPISVAVFVCSAFANTSLGLTFVCTSFLRQFFCLRLPACPPDLFNSEPSKDVARLRFLYS